MSGTRVRKRSRVDAGDAIAAVKRYSAVVDELIKDVKVKQGVPGKKGFGSEALQIDGKIFAMLSSRRQFVVKLPRDRVDALVAARRGSRFDPGHGRLMKEWFVAGPSLDRDWIALAREGLSFVVVGYK
jgi:hypothetical protein